ncbi:hypothetical protein Cgig2_029449 [Carnegiea gigantea]|uniref:NAD(P)H-hydrate epimerase n=1 Tax=Carnegiea gigantea TaxID=171969 RepID=A0A9Q1QJZ9_9CARY|nr:hypothetical protein Cgig2_029449 [Carnegiea gigantea]
MESISYLSQREAAAIDEELMGPLGFSVDQLMELAGLSVACAIHEVYKPKEYNRVLAICGPGNNGGDGLVAARHLYHFGYKPSICYPKRTPKPLYNGLVTQLESLSVPFVSAEDLPSDLSDEFDILIDAIFGFSFHGTPRPPFDAIIQKLVYCQNRHNAGLKSSPIVSVDIPSGWHVEEGDTSAEGIKPDMLVSLTAPKLCAKKFSGPHHFLGGRFVPPPIVEKYKLHLPPYPGTSMCVRIGRPPQVDISSLRENYISPPLLEDQVEADPLEQVRVEGPVEKVSEQESEKYFHSRPRGSQIGAIVSNQSSVVPGRHFLQEKYKELEEKFSDGSLIPKPKYWGGYRLKPEVYEFWQGQPSRLHDRLQYTPVEADGRRVWKIERLAP